MKTDFDIPDVDDDADALPVPDDVDIPDVADEPEPAAPPAEPSGLDFLLSLANGATLGHGAWAQDLLSKPVAEQRHPGARVEGRGVMGTLPDTRGMDVAGVAGRALPYVLATRIPGGPAVQGAIIGGLEAHGRGESVLGGAVTGGLVSGALGGLAGAASKLGAPAASAQGVLPGMGAEPLSRAGELAARYGAKAAQAFDNLEPVKGLTGKAYELGLKALEKLAPLAPALGKAAPAAGGALGGVAGDETARAGSALGSLLGASKASAQDAGPADRGMRGAPFGTMPPERTTRVDIGAPEFQRWQVDAATDAQIAPEWGVNIGEARETGAGPQATQTWAVQSVLYRGGSGLPPEAEQQLTEAVMSGDDEKLATASFLMSGKYPRFASALQKQMQSLSREED